MIASLDEVVDRLRPAGGSVQPSRGFFLRHLSAARGGALARRQAGDAGGCDLLVRCAKKNSPMYAPIISTSSRPRRSASATSSSPSTAPAIASCRRSSGELTVLPKHWWEGTDAQGRKRDITATTLEPPLGSGPYRIKEFVAGRSLVLERVKDYWGKDLPSQYRPGQFRRAPLRILSRRHGRRSKPSRPISSTGSHENSAKEWATAYDFPAVQRQARDQGRIPDPQLRGGCRASRSICAGRSSRMRGCAAPSTSPSISRR